MKRVKRGRTKGSKNKNKIIGGLEEALKHVTSVRTYDVNLEPAPTRLDVLMSELETEINRAISKMKAVF